ncbi:interferon-induced very large GTPase 1-like [Engraulis encrasicolus]|uniref:interferon-induced very large GTPase 1-like n=1 Tax=Engraulis encrasicolus TaxID=184585 RepID=UPI002FCFADE2
MSRPQTYDEQDVDSDSLAQLKLKDLDGPAGDGGGGGDELLWKTSRGKSTSKVSAMAKAFAEAGKGSSSETSLKKTSLASYPTHVRVEPSRPSSITSSAMSMKSDVSKEPDVNFRESRSKKFPASHVRDTSPVASVMSMVSRASSPIQFSSVTSDSVSLSWGCPAGLETPQRFRVVWGCGGENRSLEVEGLSVDVEGLQPGKKYNFSVVTLSSDGSQSPPVSTSVQTEVPQPENLTVVTCSSSATVKWTKPKGLNEASFSIGATKNNFLQALGLFEHQENKLTLNSVLEISHDSIFKQSCECMKDLPLYVLRKLMWCSASSSCASVCDRKTGVVEKVNPLDLLTAIVHCSDPFLQQTLFSKMSQFQLAVPLLLPNCDAQQSTLMLWALRDIVKKFKSYTSGDQRGSVECRIATADMQLVSFVRLGKNSMSKSSCLSNIIGQSQQCSSTFLHYNMECGNVPRKISDGLVEISWFLPSGKKNIDMFQQPIAFANLRGDIRMFEAQFSFLCQTSAAVFVFTNDSLSDLSILRKTDRTSQLCLVIAAQTSKSEKDILAEVGTGNTKGVNVILKGNQNDAEFNATLRKHTAAIIQKENRLISVQTMADIAVKTGLLIDERCPECEKGQELATKIISGIKDITKFKADVLSRQGHMWKEISGLEREQCQLKNPRQGDIEQHKSSLNKDVINLRAKQREVAMSKYIKYFIDGISKQGTERNYFLKSFRMMLDSLTQNKMSELKEKYKCALKQSPKNKEEIQRLEEEISLCSLGLEHFFRELGQLYESTSPGSPRAKELQHLPVVCAQLLLEGFPLELLDGDASNIPQRWIEDIFKSLCDMVKPNCLLSVVTILGVQSTGKSTLLNTMFGIQFAVSSGKCTRGAFMQLVKVSDSSIQELNCKYVMVIDTEGLKSPELAEQVDSYVHDNELATLVIGLSDVAIINISMENVTEMKDILQIAVHAFLRMKQVGKKPRCLFVHQNVPDVAAHDTNLRDRQKMVQQLNEMTEAAARMEKIKASKSFTDVMDYDPEKDSYYIPGLWQGTPPMASVSAGYSEAVCEVKRGLIDALSEIPNRQDFLQFWELTKELWQTLRFENFIFNFRNSIVAEAYSKLCQEWDKWEWAFQKEMYNWSLKAEVQIYNCGISDPDFEIPSLNALTLEASKQLDKEEKKLKDSLKQYFDKQASNKSLIENYRAEFEISVKSLRRKTEASMVSSLKAALDVQNAKQHLSAINNTQSQTIETKVLDLLNSFKGKDSGICDDMLRKEFEKMWTKTQSVFPYYELPRKNVADDAFQILQEDYKKEHLQQLLHTIDEEIEKHDIKHDDELEACLKMHIFGIAITEFQKMHNNFIDQNDPQICLERAKEKFLSEFVNLYRDRDQCQRKAAEFAKNCLAPAIFDYVTKRIGPEIVDEMKTGHDAISLSTRSSFQYKLLSELLEKNNYKDYRKFIKRYETFVKDWIFEQVVRTMSRGNILQQKEKALSSGVLKKVNDVVTSFISNPSRKVKSVRDFIKYICGKLDLILPDDALQDFMIMNSTFQTRTKEFASHLKEYIEDSLTTSGPLNFRYSKLGEVKQRLRSLTLKPQEVLFEALFGCGKRCPFCTAPCEAGGSEHKIHFSSIHRPEGTNGCHTFPSKAVKTDICSSSVISDSTFCSKETNWKFHPYKEYKTFYPEWDIPGDPTLQATAYWKFFMANFNEEIAKDYDLNPAIIPDDWKLLTQADALKNLQQAFHKVQTPL